MCLIGLMASKSGSKPSIPRSFPRSGNLSLLQNHVIVKVMLKNNAGKDRRLYVVILECFVCRWEGGEAEKVGG